MMRRAAGLQVIYLAELGAQVAHIRLGVQGLSSNPLNEVHRFEFRAVTMYFLTQPRKQLAEISAFNPASDPECPH